MCFVRWTPADTLETSCDLCQTILSLHLQCIHTLSMFSLTYSLAVLQSTSVFVETTYWLIAYYDSPSACLQCSGFSQCLMWPCCLQIGHAFTQAFDCFLRIVIAIKHLKKCQSMIQRCSWPKSITNKMDFRPFWKGKKTAAVSLSYWVCLEGLSH